MKVKEPFVITIGRCFGAGGRELGKLLSERLGVRYLDREILNEAARGVGMSPEFFQQHDERSPGFLDSVFSFAQGYIPMTTTINHNNSATRDGVQGAISQYISQLAERESCVIVGRTADYVLRDHPRCLNVFIYAPTEHCVKRIMGRGDVKDEQEARRIAVKTNKLRAAYYNFYTDKKWGDSSSYHLTFDSSKISIPQIATIIERLLEDIDEGH